MATRKVGTVFGGSGFIGGCISGDSTFTVAGSVGTTTTGNAATAYTTDAAYVAGIAQGGAPGTELVAAGSGGNGLEQPKELCAV